MKYFVSLTLKSLTYIELFNLLAMEIAIRWKAHRINVFRLIVISFYVHTIQVDLRNQHVSFENYIISKDARLVLIVFASNACVNAK